MFSVYLKILRPNITVITLIYYISTSFLSSLWNFSLREHFTWFYYSSSCCKYIYISWNTFRWTSLIKPWTV